MLIKALAAAAGNFGVTGYAINDSLRFNDNDSAYLSRTLTTPTSATKWTWSAWVKRGNISSNQMLLTAGVDADDYDYIQLGSSDQLLIYNGVGGSTGGYVYTNSVLRDPSGWYHIVVKFDGSLSSSNRVTVYVNGVTQSLTVSTAWPSGGGYINTANAHAIGVRYRPPSSYDSYFDGYMAEVNFIDGQALTADDFGQIGATTGEWSPKAYSGTYGTNGFYLPFNGNANDDSGNGNNWTENNLASTDYMIDTPTNNFSTWNPLNNIQSTSLISFSEGNLLRSESTATNTGNTSTIAPSSGKWYWESYIATSTNTNNYAAVGRLGSSYLGVSRGGTKVNLTGTASTYGGTGTLIGVAIDLDAGTFDIYENGALDSSLTFTPTGEPFSPAAIDGTTTTTTFALIANFGADSSFAGNKTRQGNTDANGIGDFYYAPPAGGYLALCTDNLPAPVIEQPETQFNVVTYTGDGADDKAITGVGFQPDMVWIKSRSNALSHNIYDSVRGVSKRIQPNLTNAESSPISGVKSFDADGFTLGNDTDDTNFTAGNTYVAWCWKAGGTAVSNTDGTITSQVSANVDAGFSIVSYTGNGTAGANVGHGLSSAPDMMIVKNRTSVDSWAVYHSSNTSAPETERLLLNATAATADSVVYWNDTAPTSSVFTLGDNAIVNQSSDNYIAYCFHSVEGFSKFGSYVGNGSSTNGPFVYTGFKPAFVMIKRTDSTSDWVITDNKRDPENDVDKRLFPNLTLADSSTANLFDYTANGFKIRRTDGFCNASGSTYIYMAFAEHPTKFSLAR